MQPTLIDRVTPTAVGVVSRAWVLREVATVPGLSETERNRYVDELAAYQPPRKHGLRDNFIAWLVMLGGAMLFNTVGLPGWMGFLLGMALLVALARTLAVKALRWRLERLREESAGRSAP